MTDSLSWYHYGLMAIVVVAALAFAYVGKMDTSAAFGIAGTAVGIVLPTAPKKADTEPAGKA